MSHTPGPWHVGNKDTPGTAVRAIATVAWCGSNASFGEMSQTISADEAYANACLIAAAPETAAERDRLKEVNREMLEALEHVMKVINSPYTPWWICSPSKGGIDADIIENAIAKAKGGTIT